MIPVSDPDGQVRPVTRALRLTPAIAVGIAASLTGCDPSSAPLVQYSGGYQETETGQLLLWTGQPCTGVTDIEFELVNDDNELTTRWKLTSRKPAGGAVEEVVLGEPLPGFRVTERSDPDPDWRGFDTVRLLIKTQQGQSATYTKVDTFTDQLPDHSSDEYFVQDQGWYTKGDFADLTDDEEVAPLCGRGTYAD